MSYMANLPGYSKAAISSRCEAERWCTKQEGKKVQQDACYKKVDFTGLLQSYMMYGWIDTIKLDVPRQSKPVTMPLFTSCIVLLCLKWRRLRIGSKLCIQGKKAKSKMLRELLSVLTIYSAEGHCSLHCVSRKERCQSASLPMLTGRAARVLTRAASCPMRM